MNVSVIFVIIPFDTSGQALRMVRFTFNCSSYHPLEVNDLRRKHMWTRSWSHPLSFTIHVFFVYSLLSLFYNQIDSIISSSLFLLSQFFQYPSKRHGNLWFLCGQPLVPNLGTSYKVIKTCRTLLFLILHTLRIWVSCLDVIPSVL